MAFGLMDSKRERVVMIEERAVGTGLVGLTRRSRRHGAGLVQASTRL